MKISKSKMVSAIGQIQHRILITRFEDNSRTPGDNGVTEAKPGLGEQAINKIAEMALTNQLEEVEKLQVDVKIDPSHLAKGEVDSLTIEGEGLVTQQDLRMDELEVQIPQIAVNPLNALFGKIQLTKPTEGTARVVLTDADISRAFKAEAVSIIGQKSVGVGIEQVECSLQADGKLVLNAEVVLPETREKQPVSLTTTPRINPSGTGVVLQDIQYGKGREILPEITTVLLEQASEILNLRNFGLEGIALSVHQIEVEAGKLTMFATAVVTKFPTA